MLASLWRWLSPDMAIDLGTANTIIYVKGAGVVLNQPSMVAFSEHQGRKKVLAVGEEARAMKGRTPRNVQVMRPMRDGVVADFEAAEDMIKYFVRKAAAGRGFAGPQAIVCVPSGSTPVERRAIHESVAIAGARRVFMIEEPVAAAIGAGLPIREAHGSMVVDIGGGTTEVAVLALGAIAYSGSVRVGGDRFDEAIVQHMRRQHNVLIGEASAEQIKRAIGAARPPANGHGGAMTVKGRDIVRGVPRDVTLSQGEIAAALAAPISAVTDKVREALESVQPELASDVAERGVVLTGGGALLEGMDSVLAEQSGLPVYIAEEPLFCVVKGSGHCLENFNAMSDVFLDAYRG